MTGYDGSWLAGKTRGRNERCYGDLRPLNDALARAFRCFIRFLCICSHWDNIGLFIPLNITPLDADQFTYGCFSVLFYNIVVLVK